MNQIRKQLKIDASRLDPNRYFESLAMQAGDCGLLSEDDFARIQAQISALIAMQADAMLRGGSSSIRIEAARQICDSIMFVVSAGLKGLQSADVAAEHIQTCSVRQMFDEGMESLRVMMAHARKLQKRIADRLFDTPNHFYKLTIIDGINGFFRLYRPQFAAQEIHITADYPICIGRPALRGIEFIEAYLRAIACENAFLLHFSPNRVHRLLLGASQDYTSCPVNLFEPVLLSALGLVLAEKSPAALNFDATDVDRILERMHGLNDVGTVRLLNDAADRLCDIIVFGKDTIAYIRMCIPRLAGAILQSIRIGAIEKCFIIPNNSEETEEIITDLAARMSDQKFNRLIENVRWLDDADRRNQMLIEQINSPEDMIDAISAMDWTAEQLRALVDALPLHIYAPILIRYNRDDFLRLDWEFTLRDALIARMKSLDGDVRKRLRQLIHNSKRENNPYQSPHDIEN